MTPPNEATTAPTEQEVNAIQGVTLRPTSNRGWAHRSLAPSAFRQRAMIDLDGVDESG